MSEIVVDVGPVAPVFAQVDTVRSLTADITQPAAITATLQAVAPISPPSVGAVAPISRTVGTISALSKTLGVVPAVTAELGAVTDPWTTSLEIASQRDRSDSIKLAASTAAVGLGASAPNYVELNTGLVVYPSFADSGYIELAMGAAFTPNGQVVTVNILMGPVGALVSIGTFVSPTFPVNAFVSQWEFFARIKSHGPTQGNYAGRMVWTDGATFLPDTPGVKDFVNRSFGFNFQDPTVDQGDCEIRADVKVTVSGTFTIRNYLIMQYGRRSGM